MVSAPAAVLIGPPGAGKTTVGQALAARWSLPFVDTDHLIEAEQGRTISDIFVEDGEPVFRALEVEAVRQALAEPAVVALGGGAPMQESVQHELAGHRVVFLEVAITDAARRIGLDRSRPLLGLHPRAAWTHLLGQRLPTYTRLAVLRIDTAGLSAAAVAARIADELPAPTSDHGE